MAHLVKSSMSNHQPSMPFDVKTIFETLQEDVIWLHAKWKVFRQPRATHAVSRPLRNAEVAASIHSLPKLSRARLHSVGCLRASRQWLSLFSRSTSKIEIKWLGKSITCPSATAQPSGAAPAGPNGKRLNLKYFSRCQTDEVSPMVRNWTAPAL